MTHLQKLRILSALKWVPFDFSENNIRLSKSILWATGSYHIGQYSRFYGRKSVVQSQNDQCLDEASSVNGENGVQSSPVGRRDAQAALLEYLHSTRSLQFVDAEYMSRNSPHFLEKLLKKAEIELDIERSITRFLRYHPINEFEPFFESIGLKPSEFVSMLPRNLMFLSDDVMLLENYHVLCNYGIPRNKVGKIYKEAKEVFRCNYDVLQSKLRAFEELGLNQCTIIKLVSSSPYLLIGNVINMDFIKILEKFKSFGFEYNWIWNILSL